MPEVYYVDGHFSVDAASYALEETARRHDSLRTTFREAKDGVFQVIHSRPIHLPVEVIDLRHLTTAPQTEHLKRAMFKACNTVFDLTRHPGIRLSAMLLSDTRAGLVITVDQIVCDGGSIAIVVDEFGELYRATREGRTPDLKPVGPPYDRFVAAQLTALDDEEAEADLAYLAKRVAGAIGSVLPGDMGPDAAVAADDLSTLLLSTELPAELVDHVVRCAQHAGTTPFAVLLTAMSVMIAIATGESDVCVGVSTSNRPHDHARTVGMFTNIVVPRFRIDPAAPFSTALADVSMNLLDAIDCRQVPFSFVEARWRDYGAQSSAELVQTTFSAGALGGLALGDCTVTDQVARSSQCPFRVRVVCEIGIEGIALDWQFAMRTYSARLAKDYCDAYAEILAALVVQPDTAMHSVGLPDILHGVVVPRIHNHGQRSRGEVDA